MTTEFMDGMYSVDPRPPAWLESYEKAATDPIVEGFGAYGAAGIPMPAVPQMAAVFADLGLAEYKIASGEDPTAVLTQAGRRRSTPPTPRSTDGERSTAHGRLHGRRGAGRGAACSST